jgi:hypothetical protein
MQERYVDHTDGLNVLQTKGRPTNKISPTYICLGLLMLSQLTTVAPSPRQGQPSCHSLVVVVTMLAEATASASCKQASLTPQPSEVYITELLRTKEVQKT